MITLIAVFCNRFRYTPPVVQSILEQDFPDLRIVFVDNGSTDETLPYLKESVFENPKKCTLVSHRTNIGKPVALNAEIKAATTPYILAMDGDVVLPKSDIISSLFATYQFLLGIYSNMALLSPRYSVICPSVGTPDNHIQRTAEMVFIEGKTFYIARTVNVAGGCQLFSKQHYTQVGGYTLSDQFYGNDDISLFKKLKKENLLSVYADGIRVIHLGDEDVKYFPIWREIKGKAHTSATQGKIYQDHSNFFI